MFGNQSKNKIYWALQIGGWSFYAIIHILLLFLPMDLKYLRIEVISILLTAGYFLLSTHIYRLMVIRLGWLNYRLVALVPRVLLSTLLLGISNNAFDIAMRYFLGTLTPQIFEPYAIIAFVLATMVWYLLWAAVYFLYHYFERTNFNLKYKAAIFEIELNQLKTQLNPHFIFNALNSIRALIDEDPVKSKTAVTQLSNILRNSLVINRKKLVELKDELSTVRDYLALESIRFEERLKVNFNISPGVESCQVPPLMIQTLVENGIKHGISKLTLGGKISVDAYMDEKSQLQIEIRNSGQVVSGSGIGSAGYGIENTTRRLNLLFGGKALFKMENESDRTVLTKITIPQSVVYESVDH